MEISKNNKNLFAFCFFAWIYFIAVHFFNEWIFRFSDIPINDDYFLIFSALGKRASVRNISPIYRLILKLFAFFTSDFYELFRINFLTVHLLFPITFFIYNRLKNVSTEVNYFLTTILVLSPLNVCVTRKIYHWEFAFFLITLIVGHLSENRYRKPLMVLFFSCLLFLRLEFVLPLSLFLFFTQYKKRNFYQSFVIFLLFLSLAILWQFYYRRDMIDLLIVQNIFSSLKINVHHYAITCLHSIYNTFYTYRFYLLTLPLMVFFIKRIRVRLVAPWEDLLLTSFLVVPVVFIKYQDFYSLYFLFFALFAISQGLEIKFKKGFHIGMYCIAIIVIVFYRPNLNAIAHYYPNYIIKGRDVLDSAAYFKSVPKAINGKIKVTSRQDVSLLISRNDMQFFTEVWRYKVEECPWLIGSPDISLFPKAALRDLKNIKCPEIGKYRIVLVLMDHVILKKI